MTKTDVSPNTDPGWCVAGWILMLVAVLAGSPAMAEGFGDLHVGASYHLQELNPPDISSGGTRYRIGGDDYEVGGFGGVARYRLSDSLSVQVTAELGGDDDQQTTLAEGVVETSETDLEYLVCAELQTEIDLVLFHPFFKFGYGVAGVETETRRTGASLSQPVTADESKNYEFPYYGMGLEFRFGPWAVQAGWNQSLDKDELDLGGPYVSFLFQLW